MIKTLIFSCCMHILNVTYILSKHLEQIQHLLNEFLWKGKNRLNQNLTCQSYEAGGLKMLKVKDSVVALRVKWMEHLWTDKGKTWSIFVWPEITK